VLEQYAAWIQSYVGKHNNFVRGKCREGAEEMASEFPELRVVKGHVDAPWGREAHWWCEHPVIGVVDPTVAQYTYPPFDYEEYVDGALVKVGKCMYCGETVWGQPNDVSTFCDAVCYAACAKHLNG
jgi:hypothetical protein